MNGGHAPTPPSAIAPGSATYRADIDGLRAIAVLAVVAFHVSPAYLPGGFVGVDVFFVISGFLITGMILAGQEQGTFRFSTFYARRALRIFPALVVVLAASLAWGWFALYADDYRPLGKHVAGAAAFVSNFILWGEAGYFDTASDTKPLLHLWSLGIEEQFYLLWPLLLYGRWPRRAGLGRVLLLVFVLSFSLGVWQVRSDAVGPFYSPLTRFWELACGGLLAYASLSRSHLPAVVALPSPVRDIASFAGLLAIAASLLLFDPETSFPGWRAMLPVGGTMLVLAAGTGAWVNRALLSRRMLVWIGLISYPLYLWHWPLLVFARLWQGDQPPLGVRLTVVGASFVLAWLTYIGIEKPIRFGRSRRAAVPVLCGLLLMLFAAGLATYRTDGFIERPVNRSDAAQFLRYYERMRTEGLRDAYREPCDFMDWTSGSNRTAISPECTSPGARGTVLLWGDSYAQALSLGLRQSLPDGVHLAQVATSQCPPRLSEPDPQAIDGRCARANAYALAAIETLRPSVVVLAQMHEHDATDWESVAAEVRARGAARVILVGPAPRWTPSLPEVVVRHHWGQDVSRVSQGLVPGVLDTDRALAALLSGSASLRYVSLVEALCDGAGCLAVVPDSDQQLLSFDQGHLSPSGSIFVVDRVLGPLLRDP